MPLEKNRHWSYALEKRRFSRLLGMALSKPTTEAAATFSTVIILEVTAW